MQDGIQVLPRAGIAENPISQSTPVEFAILGKHARAKALDHCASPGVPGATTRGPPHRRRSPETEFGEALGDSALAAGDAAGEADSQAAAMANA